MLTTIMTLLGLMPMSDNLIQSHIHDFYRFTSIEKCGLAMRAFVDAYRLNPNSSVINKRLSFIIATAWDMGSAYNNEAKLASIVDSFKLEVGHLPTAEWIARLYDGMMPAKYSNDVPAVLSVMKKDVGTGINILVGNETIQICPQELYIKYVRQYGIIDPEVESYLHGEHIVSVIYSKIDGPNAILYYNVRTKRILWASSLYGNGTQFSISGVPQKVTFQCVVNNDILEVYGFGSCGGISFEFFDSKKGAKLEAFSTKNWSYR